MTPLSVLAPGRFVRLIAADAMNVTRDPMLVFACVLSVLPAIALWLGRGALDAAGAAAGIPDLSAWFIPVALVLPAVLIGWVCGFLLLEDRDDGPLLAVEVTPVGKPGFLLYRFAVAAALAALITALAVCLLLGGEPLWLQLVLLLAIPADTVLASAALLALARNKVEGLALTKLINIAAIIPLAAFLPSPLRLLGGIVPTYWIGEILRPDGVPPALALLLATHAATGLALWRLLRRRAG